MADAKQINQDHSQQKYTAVIVILLVVISLLVIALTKKGNPADADLNLNQRQEPMEQPVPTTYQKELPDEEEIQLELQQQKTSQAQPPANQQTMIQQSDNPQQMIPENNQSPQETQMDKTNMPQPDMVIDQSREYIATMATSEGTIKLKLFADQTPITVNNFVYLAQAGFYDGLIFHRIIEDFMIQGGDPLGNGTGGPGYQFQDEDSQTKLVKGSLAMANSGPNTNGSQFFIVTADSTPWLDGKHTNFGQVIEGMQVVETLNGVETGAQDKPVRPMVIESITISEN